MAELTFLIDKGHGGTIHGVYQTAPEKMYRHENGDIAYEGVVNREYGNMAIEEMRNALVCVLERLATTIPIPTLAKLAIADMTMASNRDPWLRKPSAWAVARVSSTEEAPVISWTALKPRRISIEPTGVSRRRAKVPDSTSRTTVMDEENISMMTAKTKRPGT